MNTATPGDLSARLLAESQRRESEWAHIPTNNPRSKFVHDERLRELLREAAAALSALPAAGGAKVCPKCMGRGKRDIAHGETADCAPCKGTGIVSTTPQPSAAEDAATASLRHGASAWRMVIDAAMKSPCWESTKPIGTNIDRVLALLAAAPHDGYSVGIKACIGWVEARRNAFEEEYGLTDPSTGAMEFGSTAREEYDAELVEIEEGLRSLLVKHTPPPDAAVGAQGDGCGAAMMARLDALTQPTIGEVEVAEIIQNRTGCADSDSIYAAWAVLQALQPPAPAAHRDFIEEVNPAGDRTGYFLFAPAAGKGVDEPAGWNIRRRNGGLLITGPGGMSAHVDESLEQGIAGAVLHALAKELLSSTAALTRQPVAGDGWIERAARCAEEILRGPLIDVPPEERTNGFTTGVRHLAWMATKLAAKDVGSETKTCRWLGYLQGGLVTLGYSTLDTEKQRNLRSAAPAATPTDGGSDHG